MWTFLLAILLSQQVTVGPQYFHRLDKAALPRLFRQPLPFCDEELGGDCWRRFRDVGEAWAGDVNDDGEEELIIFPGYGGTGGQDAVLYQRHGATWKILLDYFPYDDRFLILSMTRKGFHDLCLDDYHCFKWTGKAYVRYLARDYRGLKLEYLDTRNSREAALRWMIRYAGQKRFHFVPDWYQVGMSSDLGQRLGLIRGKPNGIWAEERDELLGVRWVSVYKGGVWAVDGRRAYLILPRSAHRGCERLEFDGDWLILYGEREGLAVEKPVARLNRKTYEMEILADEPFWLDPIDD